jgi:hypothetical protein
MITTVRFNGFPFTVDFNGDQYDIEICLASTPPPFGTLASYQLIARRHDCDGRSIPYIPLSGEFQTEDEIKDKLKSGCTILHDKSLIDESRQRIIEEMLRIKAVEVVPQAPKPNQSPSD